MENVQKLALVFVQALNLDVKNAVRVKEVVLRVLEEVGQYLLVGVLDFYQLVKAGLVVGEFFKLLELCQILFPAVADSLCDEFGERRVGVQKPAALGDSVCLVVELGRIEFRPVLELLCLEQFCVKLGDAVYAKASVDGKPSHLDLAVSDD